MSSSEKRREVFSSFTSFFSKKDEEVVLRPPYFSDFTLFNKECPTCEDKACATFCEEEIIKIDKEGLPYISFEDSGCTYCDKCADSCSQGVLDITCKTNINAKVSISTTGCLAWDGVICSSCLDSCDEKAIEFFCMLRPKIDMNLCSSCGFCYSVCPTNAIEFKAKRSLK